MQRFSEFEAQLFEQCFKARWVIQLDLDLSLRERSTAAEFAFQVGCEVGELRLGVMWFEPVEYMDDLTTTMSGGSPDQDFSWRGDTLAGGSLGKFGAGGKLGSVEVESGKRVEETGLWAGEGDAFVRGP